jgi:hypothetical protein
LLLDLIAREAKPCDDERLELNLLFFRLEDEADSGFIFRYKRLLREIEVIRNIVLNPELTATIASNVAKNYLRSHSSEVQLHNAYFGKVKQNPPPSLLRKRTPQQVRKIRNRKKFIGVGYKDHGNMKNKAVDGSPSWQEVANERLWQKEELPYYPVSDAFEEILWLWYGRFHRMWEEVYVEDEDEKIQTELVSLRKNDKRRTTKYSVKQRRISSFSRKKSS